MRDSKYNYLLENNYYMYYKCYRRYMYYLGRQDSGYGEIPVHIQPYYCFADFFQRNPIIASDCFRLYESHRRKTKRIKSRVWRMLFGTADFDAIVFNNTDYSLNDCLFLTLTFSDDVLESTSQKSRRTYVARFLKSVCTNYIANIDFGDECGREHYHAVVQLSDIDLDSWQYGYMFAERVINSYDKLSNYINKLTFHSVKDTTGYVIYSR